MNEEARASPADPDSSPKSKFCRSEIRRRLQPCREYSGKQRRQKACDNNAAPWLHKRAFVKVLSYFPHRFFYNPHHSISSFPPSSSFLNLPHLSRLNLFISPSFFSFCFYTNFIFQSFSPPSFSFFFPIFLFIPFPHPFS